MLVSIVTESRLTRRREDECKRGEAEDEDCDMDVREGDDLAPLPLVWPSSDMARRN